MDVMGGDILAQIARDLVAVMRRDTRTDWTVRDDVKAKLRSSIKRLLVKSGYPPDKQPGAIKLVIDQMEAMAPTFAEERKTVRVREPARLRRLTGSARSALPECARSGHRSQPTPPTPLV
jgi:Domain of unknown function (DUF3387).